MKELRLFLDNEMSVLLIGPTGCGKTEGSERVFKDRNQPYVVLDCSHDTRADDVEGSDKLISGEGGGTLTEFRLANPMLACRDGHGVLVNEADALPSGAAFALYSALNGKDVNILRHGIVKLHPDTRFVGTQNTEGRGDMTGLYTGRVMQDESFLNRWDQFIRAGYPSVEEEALILTKTTGIDQDRAEKIAATASALRRLTSKGMVLFSAGIKRTKNVAKNMILGFTPEKAWDHALGNRLTAEDSGKLVEAVQRHFGSKP